MSNPPPAVWDEEMVDQYASRAPSSSNAMRPGNGDAENGTSIGGNKELGRNASNTSLSVSWSANLVEERSPEEEFPDLFGDEEGEYEKAAAIAAAIREQQQQQQQQQHPRQPKR